MRYVFCACFRNGGGIILCGKQGLFLKIASKHFRSHKIPYKRDEVMHFLKLLKKLGAKLRMEQRGYSYS